MSDTRVSDALRLASNDERLQQGGQRDYVLSEVRAALQSALELEQQVESLRAASEAIWSELVKRGLASEIGPDKLRSLKADSQIHAECAIQRDALLADKERLLNPMLIALEIAQSSLEKQIGGSAALEIVTLAIDAARKPVSREPAK